MEGVKYLPYGNWSPVATQLSTGVGVAAQPRGWPIAFTADFIFSFLPRNETVGATKTKLFADSIEATLGLQKVLDFGNVHPYAGVGTGIAAARVSSDLTTTPPSLPASTERSGGGFGGFVGGGTYYTVDGRNGRVCLGLAVRYSVFPFHATGPAPGGLNTAVLVGITF
jgi:hypothetical protein